MWDLLFFVSIYCVRPLTVLIHELGHAIPVVVLTRKKAQVFVGTYGSSKGCVKVPLGVLHIYLYFNPLGWNKGVCIPEAKEIPVDKQIVYTLCGPIASLIVAVTILLLRPAQHGYSYAGFFLILFLCSAVFDLFYNLVPRHRPIMLDDGSLVYNDGKSLSILFQIRKLKKELTEAYPLYQANKFSESYALLKTAIESGEHHPVIYKLALSALTRIRPSDDDLPFLRQTEASGKVEKEDLINLGVCFAMLKQTEEARKIFATLIGHNPNDLYATANMGYILLSGKDYEAALEKFHLTTRLGPKFAYGFANRGLTKIYLGDHEAGLADIQHALTLDPNDASSHSSLGTYHMKKKEYSLALPHYEKARSLNAHIDNIDELIARAKEGRDIDDL